VDSDQFVDALLVAPVAAGVVVVAARSGIGLAGLTDPVTVTTLAAAVCGELSPWSGEHRELAAWLLEQARPLRGLVVDLVDHPGTQWWSQLLDRSAQLVLGDDAVGPPVFTTDRSPWQDYAQRPTACVTSSTALTPVETEPIRSGRHAVAAVGRSDWEPTYPLPQAQLRIHSDARIAEITGPDDWNRLVQRYPHPHHAQQGAVNQNLHESAGIRNGPAPDWADAADDLDGVHFTFAGMLTALFVPTTHDGVLTTLWAPESESTLWLRQVWEEPRQGTAYPPHLDLPGDVAAAISEHVVLADRPRREPLHWLR